MNRCLSLAALVILCPSLASGQGAPEDLLPATTQVYLCWDGIDAHRAAYARTAVGQVLQGDTGVMLDKVHGLLQQMLKSSLSSTTVNKGLPLDRIKTLQTAAKEVAGLASLLGKHGVILAVEVGGVSRQP